MCTCGITLPAGTVSYGITPSGCQSWLVVTRDLRNHEITKVELARDVALASALARTEAP